MTVNYKKLTDVMLTQIWPHFVELTEQHKKDNNLTDEMNEVNWEAITKPGLFTFGLFIITSLLKTEQEQKSVTFYISIPAQEIELRLQFNSSVGTLNDALTFSPTPTSSNNFKRASLDNVGGDWEKWLTLAAKENTAPQNIKLA